MRKFFFFRSSFRQRQKQHCGIETPATARLSYSTAMKLRRDFLHFNLFDDLRESIEAAQTFIESFNESRTLTIADRQ